MPKLMPRKALYCAILLTSTSMPAQAQTDSLSLIGISGNLNVPNAHVLQNGALTTGYSNLKIANRSYIDYNNFLVNIGIFPHVEIGARITWLETHKNMFLNSTKPQVRDLSANIKINIPYIPDNWFDLAIGQQDAGGAANLFDAEYIVLSKQLGWFRFDIGQGRSNTGRLDGTFGAIDFSPYEWISFIAEHDAIEANAGIRLSTPSSWLPDGFRVELTSLLKTDHPNSEDRKFFGLSVTIPLGSANQGGMQRTTNRLPIIDTPNIAATANSSEAMGVNSAHKNVGKEANMETHKVSKQAFDLARKIEKTVKASGFDQVNAGFVGNRLIVAFENNIYNRSELDALGVVMAIATQQASSLEKVTVMLRNQGFEIFAIDIEPQNYQAFLNNDAPAKLYAYYPSDSDLSAIRWLTDTNRKIDLKPRFTLYPALISAVATEIGVWDYSFGLAINASMHLWKGAMVNLVHTTELDYSDDFEKDAYFTENKIPNAIQELTLQQGIRIGKYAINNFNFGKFRYDYSGFQNQLLIHDTSGRHQLNVRIGSYSHIDTDDSHDISLFSYRYYIPAYDTTLSATYGNFWGNDTGFKISSAFRFGDSTVDLSYTKTTPKNSNSDDQFIGLALSIPLTTKKDWDSKYIQVRGIESWRYGLQTRINQPVNYISFTVADTAEQEWQIERTYLNNDKLTPEYLYQNLWRLKKQ